MTVTAFLVILFTAAALATPFQNCGTTIPAIAVNVSGCVITPCVIARGQILTGNLTFSVDHNVSFLKSSLIVHIPGAPNDAYIPLPSNACDHVSGGCPLLAYSANVFSFNIRIGRTGYEGKVTAELSLSDEHEHNVACVVVSGILSSDPKKII